MFSVQLSEAGTDLPRSQVAGTWHSDGLYPYHIQEVQQLLPEDRAIVGRVNTGYELLSVHG